MKKDMANVTKEFDKQTGSFPDAVKALYGLTSSSSVPAPVAPADIPSGYYQASDGLLYKK